MTSSGGLNGTQGEASPLLLSSTTAVSSPPSNASGGAATNYYFLGKGNSTLGGDYQGVGTSDAVRDADGGEVVEGLPQGSTTDEFAPKQLGIPAVSTIY